MITLPITKHAKQQECNTILSIAESNGFPLHIIHNLKHKLITKTQQRKTVQTRQKKKWVTFTYHSSRIHKVTNLLGHTNLNIAFRATNNIKTTQRYNTTKQNTLKWDI